MPFILAHKELSLVSGNSISVSRQVEFHYSAISSLNDGFLNWHEM